MRSPSPSRPDPAAADLVARGWTMAEATLAVADSERKLVTHWFLTPEDTSVNADDHFGSDERTLRFLGVALPTLIDQLGATIAVVVLPFELESPRPTLTVVALGLGERARLETRPLTRLAADRRPPFWRLEPDRLPPPDRLVTVASGLARSSRH